MPLIRTTLTAAIKTNDLVWAVASTATGFPAVGVLANPPQPITVDDEEAVLVQVLAPGSILVRMRGSGGTAAGPHDVGSAVASSAAPSDFPALNPGASTLRVPDQPDIVTYGQDGAIAVPVEPITVAYLAKSGAGAFTLAAPSLALNGVLLILTSQTAAAHVVTAPALLNTGASGSPFGTATFPAFVGASVSLIAQNGSWNVQTTQGAIVFTA